MKKQLLFTVCLLLFGSGFAQTQFWSDNFEDSGAPSSGTRNASVENSSGGPPATRYFWRCGTSNINTVSAYTNVEGSKFWAGEDHRLSPISQSGHQSVTWNSVNISGKTGLSFKGMFASGPPNFDIPPSSPVSDYVIVEYRIDGGAWQSGLRFFPYNPTIATYLSLETTGDSVGEGATLLNSANFTEFNFNIAGTGNTLDLRLKAHSNGTSEEWAVDNFRLFETPACTAPVITANPPNRSICVNGNTTFTSSATGATAYQWQVNTGSGFTDIANGGVYSNATTNTLTITGATSGMNGYLYRCTAINGVASCFTNSNSATLNISNITSSTAQNNIACFGQSTGSAAVSPTGGIGSYTYSWSPSGGTASNATGLSAGSYTVTITDAISCQITKNITITQPTSALNTSAGSQSNVSCNSGANGTATVSPTGGTPGYSYSWSPSGGTAATASGLSAGSYTVTVTDANACTATRNFTITQPTALNGSTVVTNVACFGGNTGAINLTPSGGTPGYTFSWSGGATTEDRTSLTAGSYSVTITDANACTRVVNVTVTQPASAVSGTTVVTNVACFGGNTGAINLTPTGGVGPYTFNWVGGATTEDRTSLAAGTYSVTITDANACTGTVSPTVTQPAAAVSGTTVVTNVACFGGNTGAINLTPTGGVGPYTFNWASGPTTEDRTSLTAGTYSVTITDANACTGTVNATVTQPTASVSGTTVVSNVSCFGGSNGTINLTPTGGVGPYTYNWASGPTTEDRTGLTTGTYSVTITDANGCTGTVSGITVTQPIASVSGTTVVTNVSCFGGSNGAINLTPTGGVGPYTFNWASGPTTEDRTGLTAGTYSVTITDANGCTGTVSPIVTQPSSPVSGTTVVTNVACFGGNTGSINLTPTGGTGPYTFNWAGGITTEDRTSLVAGTYSVTITDANGCTGTVSPTVTQPASALSGTTVVTNVACFGGNTGAINLTPTGGVGPYTYSWVSGPTTEDRTSLIAGTYSVTITDANACTATVNATVTQPAAAVSGTTVATNVSCFNGSNGTINLTPTGGVGPYTFNWVGGATTEDRTGLTAGTYSVTITDANGCNGTVSGITLTQPTAISVTAAAQTNIACNGGSNGSATINTPTGGTPGYTYDWSPGTPTGDGTTSISEIGAGTHTVMVTDANGCTASQAFTITEPSAISFTAASQTNIACFGGNTGAFTVNTPTGGAGSFTYDWAPGTPTGDGTTSVTGLTAGTYSVTTTDANGCTASISFTITQPPVLTVTGASQTEVSCNGGANGTATVSVSGGTPGYTYSWSPSVGTTATVSGLSAGSYTATVTDANGCQVTQPFTITEPTALDASAGSQVDVLCNGGSTGSATVTPTGGTGAYAYSWSPSGGTSGTASGLTAGTYTVTVTDDNNCQATKTFTITESALITSSFSHSACNSYTWGTQTHSTSGVYTQTFAASNGCDSIVTLTLSIINEITNTVTESSCNSYTWAQNGMTYTTSGMYVDTIQSVGGCDSIVTLDLTINTPTSSSSSEFACGSYTWTQNGMTYTASGVYMDTIPNAAGCDSIITLNLTIGGFSSTQTASACGSYTWAENGVTYTTSGMYSDSLVDINGCDSILILDLTINPAVNATATDNGNATITASTGTTYQWINCTTNTPIANATAQTFAATANGTYAVIVSNGTCSDTSNCVNITNVGIKENTISTFSLHPNPTHDVVIVTMDASSAIVEVTDVQGKLVQTTQIKSGDQVDLSAYERGVYTLRIKTELGTSIQRIVKN